MSCTRSLSGVSAAVLTMSTRQGRHNKRELSEDSNISDDAVAKRIVVTTDQLFDTDIAKDIANEVHDIDNISKYDYFVVPADVPLRRSLSQSSISKVQSSESTQPHNVKQPKVTKGTKLTAIMPVVASKCTQNTKVSKAIGSSSTSTLPIAHSISSIDDAIESVLNQSQDVSVNADKCHNLSLKTQAETWAYPRGGQGGHAPPPPIKK